MNSFVFGFLSALCVSAVNTNLPANTPGGSVQHSILFPRVYIGDEAVVREAILFDGVEVGNGARLSNCIIDKDVRIPAAETVGIDPDKDTQRFTISPKGIVVVPKGYRFGDGN